MRRIPNSRMIAALREGRGYLTHAAAILGCNRKTVRERIDSSPEVRAAYDEMTERRLDEAEFRLAAAVEKGEPWAIQYTLDNLGRQRGYGRREIDVHADAEVRVGVLPPEDAAARIRALAAAGASAPAIAAPPAATKTLPVPRHKPKGHAAP